MLSFQRAFKPQHCDLQVWLGGSLRAQVLGCVRAAIKASTAEAADMRFLVTGKHSLPSTSKQSPRPPWRCICRWQFVIDFCQIWRIWQKLAIRGNPKPFGYFCA